MNEIKDFVEKLLNSNATEPIGYSICGYEVNGNSIYDIYLPTKAMDYMYFMHYKNGLIYDIDLNLSNADNYKTLRIRTQDLIERNFSKILIYENIFIIGYVIFS